MKRSNIFLILVFMACSCWINGAFAQVEVTFPDINLEAAVKKALRIADADPILDTALEDLTRLTATNKEIANLTGLEEATGLTDLDLGNNVIVNLAPLSNLITLEELDLADNQIVDLFPLEALTNLTDLDLDGNRIVGISNLSRLSNLETLDLTYNRVEDVTPLSGLMTLKRLYLRYNDNLIDDLTDSRQLANARQLVKLKAAKVSVDITLPRAVTFRDDNLAAAVRETLSLEPEDPIFPEDMKTLTTFSRVGADIVNLTGLETATALTDLTLSDNKIVSVSPLSKLTGLTNLNLSGNSISSISSLAKLTSLTNLNLSNNKISSVSSLSKLTSLTTLNLAGNRIRSLSPLSGLITLTDLELHDNQITDVLALQGLSNLNNLLLDGNDNLTKEKASVLYTLQQANPSISIVLPFGIFLPNPQDIVEFNNANLATAVRSALRITKGYPILKGPIDDNEKDITDLTRLTATRKQIDDLTGLEEATGLTTLDLGQNAIENLTPLQSLTSLTTLDLADNLIENFSPLSGLTSLTTLDLGQNAIVNVPALPNLSSLETLDLADNQIQNVSSLSGLSVLETLDLRNNSVEDVTRLSELTTLKKLYLRGNADLIDDLTDSRQLANARQLVKLKAAKVSVDITLPRAVTFRDNNLVEELRTRLGLGDGDPIFPADMQTQTFTTFNASNLSIVTLTGLETAINLTDLTLNDNAIASLTPLARLVNLETLNLADNEKISSISSLAKLTSLTNLNLSNNKISSVSSLSKLVALETLNLSMNQISSLTSLSGLTSLRSLDLSENRIRDVLPLQGLSSLRTLNLSGNTDLTMEKASVLYTLQQGGTNITLPQGTILPNPADIVVFNNANLAAVVRSALRITKGYPILKGPITDQMDITDLTRLTATRKQIDDLTGLEEATGLTSLDLGQNVIVNLSPLQNLPSLTTLDLADNQIQNISALSGLSSLTSLDLGQNAIENVPALPNLSSLTSLDLADNQIQGVSTLSGLSALKTLDLRDNSRSDQKDNDVTDVTPLSGLEMLKTLYLRGNDNLIDDLTVAGKLANARALVKLKFGDTRTTIDLTLPRAVTFRDDNLAAALRTRLGLQTGDPIFPADMQTQTFTTFSAPSQSIVTLTGLETAINLTDLTLNDNAIASLTPLARLVNLETLNLADNEKISSISSLAKLTVLTNLNLSNNKISSVSSLSKLVALETLNLSMNQISSLTSLSGLSSLTNLNLSNNTRIKDVLPLQGLSTLRTLDLSGNTGITMEKASVLYALEQGITNIILPQGIALPDLANIVRFNNTDLAAAVRTALRITKGYPILTTGDKAINTLTRLTATRKEIADLTGLEVATGLTTLDLGDNAIETLTPLQNLTSLTTLDLADNEIETLTPLQSLTSLTNLDLDGNDIQNVSALSGLSSLTTLDLRDNDVRDVTPLSGLTTLKYLYVRDNDKLVNVKQLVKLEGTRIDIKLPVPVQIPDTNLAAALRTQIGLPTDDPIFPGDMEGLTRVRATNDSISDLTGLETATGLTDLTLSNNAIDDLDPISELTSLTDLDLRDNQIVDVSPLEELTSLERLDLSNNQIEDVAPLASLTNLTRLTLTGNSGITNPGALYQLDQGGTTIIGVTVPRAVTFTDANLETAVKKALKIATADPVLPDAMAMLTRLTASRKTITSLSGLETAGILERLDVGQNSISDLSPLSGLTRLEQLDVADNSAITTIASLSGLTSLERLDLRNTGITSIEPLKDLTSLEYIYLRGTYENITDLEWLGALPNLRSDIKLPSVVSIPDTNLDAAVRTTLSVTGTLPMSEEMLESLLTLDASGSGIEDLTGCEYMTELTSLDLSNNQITDVSPLSKLYSLETLMLDGNTILDTSPLYGLLSRNLNNVDITIYRYPSWDVNQDGDVDKADLYLITLIITGTRQDINGDGTFDADDETAADVNRDGSRNINDLRFVFDYLDRPVNLGAPLLHAETGLLELSMLEQMDADGLRVQLEILRATNDGSLNYQQTVAFLQAILTAIQPNQTVLLANYPNPFNPETWIPYQLARDSHVQVTIYDTQGAVVRRLDLGYRVEGFYTTRGKAAHWDGRNAVGERVASGIYFYQLETDDVSLLRKMVILK